MLEVAHGLLDVSCCACLIQMVCQVGGTFLWLLPGCALERIGDPHVERSGRPVSSLTLAPHRSGRAGSVVGLRALRHLRGWNVQPSAVDRSAAAGGGHVKTHARITGDASVGVDVRGDGG